MRRTLTLSIIFIKINYIQQYTHKEESRRQLVAFQPAVLLFDCVRERTDRVTVHITLSYLLLLCEMLIVTIFSYFSCSSNYSERLLNNTDRL